MEDVRALIGCLCETCECPVQVRFHPESGKEELFCITCDVFTITDHLVDPWCNASRMAPSGGYAQHCGGTLGHDGPHRWTCDQPSPDGLEVCHRFAGHRPEDEHEFDEREFRPAPRCRSLVRSWPHGFVFRCTRQPGHNDAHVANVSYALGNQLYENTAEWVLPDRMVDYVPNADGVRIVPVEDAPVTCGRCGHSRTLLGSPEDGVTEWTCDSCAELQYDVVDPGEAEAPDNHDELQT